MKKTYLISNATIEANNNNGYLVVADSEQFGKREVLFESPFKEECQAYIIKHTAEQTAEEIETVISKLPDVKKEVLKKALDRNCALTTSWEMESLEVRVYTEGRYYMFAGCRCAFNVFINNAGEAIRKPTERKLHYVKTEEINVNKVNFSKALADQTATQEPQQTTETTAETETAQEEIADIKESEGGASMASIKEIVRFWENEIREGMAWLAIWKEGRAWKATYFYLDSKDDFENGSEDVAEALEIVEADKGAILVNGYYNTLDDLTNAEIAETLKDYYNNGYNLLINNIAFVRATEPEEATPAEPESPKTTESSIQKFASDHIENSKNQTTKNAEIDACRAGGLKNSLQGKALEVLATALVSFTAERQDQAPTAEEIQQEITDVQRDLLNGNVAVYLEYLEGVAEDAEEPEERTYAEQLAKQLQAVERKEVIA